jgi:hypothetical protein
VITCVQKSAISLRNLSLFMKLRMKTFKYLLAGFVFAGAFLAASHAESDFDGQWKIDLTKSSALDPWDTMSLTIEVDGDDVSIVRKFGGDKRNAQESMTLDLTQASQVVEVEGWWDNRHIGAYLGGNKQQTVAAKWLDDGRTLQLDIEMILETAQGDTPVRVLREMRLSRNGQTMHVLQLRSSRNLPIVRVFRKQ